MGKSIRNQKPTQLWFREETILRMLYAGFLVDGRKGGLVIGPSHKEGNIYLLYEEQPGRYRIVGSMEGGEYLLSHTAYLMFNSRIDEINAWEDLTDLVQKIEISEKTRNINACGGLSDGVILIDCRGQFIVNKHATGKFFTEIENFNYQAEVKLRGKNDGAVDYYG